MAKRNLRAVDAINARIAAGSRMRRLHGDAGNESKQHQPVGKLVGQIQRLQHARLRPPQIRQCPLPSVETHLQFPVYPLDSSGPWVGEKAKRCYTRGVADIPVAALPRKVMAQVYLPKQACRHAKISRQQLTKWQEAGLIARADSYEYRDIVTLRALEGMKRAGLKGRRLREAVAWLRKRLPERDELLDQVRVTRRGRRTFVRVPGQEVELWSGQLQLSFDTGEAVALEAKEKSVDERRKRAEAEQWFQRGLELEQRGASFDEVVEAYRTACEMDNKSPGAFVNLGTVYFNARMWRESERYYRLALEADASYPLAHFNLANLCDERGDKQRAFHHYEEAVRLKPGYADAHYNLALLYQSAGQTMKALKHWRTYLRLDPASAWAEIARRELKKLQDSALVEGRSNAS